MNQDTDHRSTSEDPEFPLLKYSELYADKPLPMRRRCNELLDYESTAARIRNPTSDLQLKRDRARLEYYDRFDPVFGKWGDRAFPY